MTYAVLMHPKALKELEIDEPVISGVKGHLRELGVDPTAQGKQLKH